MAGETKQPRARSGKRIRRIRIGFNVLAQIILILFLAVMVNSIAFKHYARWDFSRDQKYELSNKTVKASEMADVDQSGMALGEGPRVTAFKGEQAITSAMMDLVEGKKNALGYVLGHKEPPLSEN